MSRKLVTAVVAVMVGAMLAVAPATAKVPKGNGLHFEVGVTCDGGPSMTVLITHGDSPTGWFPSTGQHIVIKTFSGIFTFTPEGGGAPIVESFTKTYGQKTGLGTALMCSQAFEETIPGEGTVTGSITAEVFVVPPSK